MPLHDFVASLAPAPDPGFRPSLFRADRPTERAALEALLQSGAVVTVHDALHRQLIELAEVEDPTRKWTDAELDAAATELLGGLPAEHYGTWVYYPWRRAVVHVLPREPFRRIRSSRNQHKILAGEQALLADKTIGIVGLSVGQGVALTLATEGIGTRYRLADMDALDLSNMNRLRASLVDIGVHKASIAARQMFEIDPYLEVEVFDRGVHADNADAFMAGLDLLVEECDDLFTKVRLRELAKVHAVPVLMVTNDRGLVDVERFDKEPERPLFHGLAGELRAEELIGLSTKDKVPYVLRIVGENECSPRFLGSLLEIDQTLVSFPQLASEALLSGAMGADVARRMMLGTFNSSGRYYLDVERAVGDEVGDFLAEARPFEEEVSPEALLEPEAPAFEAGSGLSRDTVRSIVRMGTLAPTGGNCQPWEFLYDDGRLRCTHDVGRSESFLDFRHTASWMALGSAAENMVIAAAGAGAGVEVEPFPVPGDPRRVFDLTLLPGRAEPGADELLPAVTARATNRRLGPRVPLAEAERGALLAEGGRFGARLQLIEDPALLHELGEILGAGDRLRLQHQVMHREMMSEMRWTREEVERTRDGLDLATLEMTPSDQAGLRILANWNAMSFLGRVGVGKALESTSRKAVAAASALGLLTVPRSRPEDWFHGGRALERVWLRATALGLAFQPMTALVYVFARLEQEGPGAFDKRQARILRELRERYLAIFEVPQGSAEIMLFRFAHAPPPSARALRRPVDAVLRFAEDLPLRRSA